MTEVPLVDRARVLSADYERLIAQRVAPEAALHAQEQRLARMVPGLLEEIGRLERVVLRVEQLASDPLFLHDRAPEETITVAQLRAALDGKEPGRD